MAMEMRQQLKLSQQLVMTPQLQQAIKLLQLSRMELVDLVREEMLENPVLEDDFEVGSDPNRDVEKVDDKERHAESAGNTETPVSEPVQGEATEVKGDDSAVNEIDWENYLDNYTMAPPMPSYRADGDEMPSLEATLTRGESLHDHLEWQLRMSDLSDEQKALGEIILGNIDADGYLKEPPLEHIAAEAGVDVMAAELALEKIQSFDPVGVGARSLAECMLIQAIHCGQDDDLLVKIIKDHLGNLEKKNYQAIARDLKEPIEEIYEAAKAIMELDPRPGRQYASDEPHYITPRCLHPQSWRQILRRPQRRRSPQAQDFQLLSERDGRLKRGQRIHPGQAAVGAVAHSLHPAAAADDHQSHRVDHQVSARVLSRRASPT